MKRNAIACIVLAAATFLSAAQESALSDYCSLDSFSLLSEITVGECEEFLIQNIDPDRLALSVLLPNEVAK